MQLKLNLEIHAWINCYILWSSDSLPADSTHILNSNPLWTEADIYGKSDSKIYLKTPKSPSWEGIYLSPMNQEVNQYLREVIREICDNHKILLCFDEMQAGFYRTGEKFGYQHYDVIADIIFVYSL